ncbi:hypothetical protein D3C80_1731640 [compost metagenome]
MGVDHHAHARIAQDVLLPLLDPLFAIDRHLDQGEGIEHTRRDGDGAAVAHAADADATEATIVDASIHRTPAVEGAETVRAEDFLADLAGFFKVVGMANLIA